MRQRLDFACETSAKSERERDNENDIFDLDLFRKGQKAEGY